MRKTTYVILFTIPQQEPDNVPSAKIILLHNEKLFMAHSKTQESKVKTQEL